MPANRAEDATAEDFLDLLHRRHSAIISGRPDKRPGDFKEKRNQAGSYVFVEPELTVGPLAEGFRRVDDLPHRFPRTAFQLFLISDPDIAARVLIGLSGRFERR